MDNKIKEALKQGTENLKPSKEQVWENILTQTRPSRGQNNTMQSNHEAPKRRFSGWASAAAAVMLTVFLISAPGQAAIQRVKEYFVPEKTIIQDLEGQPHETDVSLQIGEAGYVIYFDAERYEFVEFEGKDRIVPILVGDTTHLPEVFMEIEQVANMTPDELAEQLEEQLRETYLKGESEFESVENQGYVDQPVKGIFILAQGDVKSESGITGFGPVEKIYLVDNEQGGTFIIRQKLFYEAEEGHGQRFNQMLKDFQVVELGNN